MDPRKVFKRYDIRGEYPREIDENFSEDIGKATGTFSLKKGVNKIIVSRDNRESSKHVKKALIDGLRYTGVNIIDIGEGPTDRLAIAAKIHGAIGIQVTASHLSWDKTGFKMVYRKGNGFSNDDMDEIKKTFLEKDFVTRGESFEIDNSFEFDETYEEELLDYIGDINGRKRKVVLDCCNGTAKRFAPRIFEKLGFHVIEAEREEIDPYPREENRKFVEKMVKESDAILGIGFDPDADRVYVIHPEKGWIDGNNIIYCLIKMKGAEKVALSVDTSKIVENTGADIRYSRVGDIFVSELGLDMEADLLGEPNGHYALTDFCWYNSGIMIGAYIANNEEEFSELLDEIPKNHTVNRNLQTTGKAAKMRKIEKAIKYVVNNFDVLNNIDGIKFEGEGFTALIRSSGTSNKIRITVNGEKKSRVEEIADMLYELLS